MAVRNYRIGNDLVVLWAICNRDGSPYDLADKQIRLYVTNERGRKEVKPVLTALSDGTVNNVIRWDFRGIEQRVTGLYTLSVEIFTAYGKKSITKDCCDAFYLVSSSSLEDEVLEENISDGGELMLSSSLDVIHVTAPFVEIGKNGNWFIDGIDTNVSALGKAGSADWNASENEAGFIKNRTHYKGFTTWKDIEISGSTATINGISEYESIVINHPDYTEPVSLSENVRYNVTFDGMGLVQITINPASDIIKVVATSGNITADFINDNIRPFVIVPLGMEYLPKGLLTSEELDALREEITKNEEVTATALTELDTRLTSFENKDDSDKETINASISSLQTEVESKATKAELSSLQSAVNTKANASDVTSLQTGLQSKADKSEVTALQTEIQAKAEKEEVDALRQEVIDNEEITAAAFSDMRNFVEESIGNSVEQEVSGEKVYAIADGILSNTNDVYYHLPYINEEDVDHTLATKGDIQSAIASAITTTLNTEV